MFLFGNKGGGGGGGGGGVVLSFSLSLVPRCTSHSLYISKNAFVLPVLYPKYKCMNGLFQPARSWTAMSKYPDHTKHTPLQFSPFQITKSII